MPLTESNGFAYFALPSIAEYSRKTFGYHSRAPGADAPFCAVSWPNERSHRRRSEFNKAAFFKLIIECESDTLITGNLDADRSGPAQVWMVHLHAVDGWLAQ